MITIENLVTDPDDDGLRLRYAAVVKAVGDPRGELIDVQRKRQEHPHGDTWRDREQRIFDRHGEDLLGSLSGAWKPLSHPAAPVRLEWHLGFIRTAAFGWPDLTDPIAGDPALVGELLCHRSGALLQHLVLAHLSVDRFGYFQDAIDLLASAAAPPPLRSLVVGDYLVRDAQGFFANDLRCDGFPWTRLGDPGAVWSRYPTLRDVRLCGGDVTLERPVNLPQVRRFELCTFGVSPSDLRLLGRATWPALDRLEVWLANDTEFGKAPCNPKTSCASCPHWPDGHRGCDISD